MTLGYIVLLAFLIFGFGFVIFWHELGHFLAAKWAGVQVEQFAVGFGQALVSWRQGMGFKVGTSRPEYEKRLREWLDANQEAAMKDDPAYVNLSNDKQRLDYASAKLGISPTEYRLNWMPLGGYVKMLGQDDLDPTARSDSPDSYNSKSIGARMVIVSAGVIMNVILAIALFVLLFLVGFNAQRPVVGLVASGSPAQKAGINVGDKVLEIDGWEQHDFNKIRPNVALAGEGEALKILIERADGKTIDTLNVVPGRSDGDPSGFLAIGIGGISSLRGHPAAQVPADMKQLVEESAVRADEIIVAVNGTAVQAENYKDYMVLDAAMQTGKEVTLTVRDLQGAMHERKTTPRFAPTFGFPLNFAGMITRTQIVEVQDWSSAKGKLLDGDIVDEIRIPQNNDRIAHPSHLTLVKLLDNAGQNGRMVDLTVIRNGERVTMAGLDPTRNVDPNRKGLGIRLGLDEDHAVVSEVMPESAAAKAGIPSGAAITAVAGQPVSSWRDVHRHLIAATAGQPVTVSYTVDGQSKQAELNFTPEQLAAVQANHFIPDLFLDESTFERQTSSPIEAAQWGVLETRDLMVQFYNMLRRMIQGSVSAKHAIGPVGIFDFGSKIAGKGPDWVIWFLAMISANLAVVNFLPFPIVDGGLFIFLILEKIMGRPLSPRTQGIVQLVGLAMIVGVFLFVTYHDITRLIY